MSRWRALAYVRDVPDSELRERLTDVVEDLYDAASCSDYFSGRIPCGAALRDEMVGLQEAVDEAERARDVAEDRLEEKLQSDSDPESLESRVRELEAERDALQERVAALEIESVAYSDALAFARRFVSVGEKSRAPVKHARSVRPVKVRK